MCFHPYGNWVHRQSVISVLSCSCQLNFSFFLVNYQSITQSDITLIQSVVNWISVYCKSCSSCITSKKHFIVRSNNALIYIFRVIIETNISLDFGLFSLLLGYNHSIIRFYMTLNFKPADNALTLHLHWFHTDSILAVTISLATQWHDTNNGWEF